MVQGSISTRFRTPLRRVALALSVIASHAARAQSPPSTSSLIDSLRGRVGLTTQDAWTVLGRRGLPLVEPTANDSEHCVVTFVWRGDSTTRNVVLVTPLTLVDFTSSIMMRLGQTDLWYRSVTLPTDARFAYRFAPNDNLVPFEQDTNIFARFATMRQDPANSKVFDYGAFGHLSILELPRAPNDSLIRRHPNRETGVVTRGVIASHALGHERVVWVYTPARDMRTRPTRYGLVIFSDGESYQSQIPTPVILDNMIADGMIPPVVAVFVETPSATREPDLSCNARWSTFVATELVPWMDAHYLVTRDPRGRVIAGYSLGGLAAACAAVQYPATIGNVIAQSGSFFRAPDGEPPEALARQLAGRPRRPINFSLSIGRYETAAIPSRDPSMLTASRHLRDVLIAKGYAVIYREFSSGHEPVAWRATLGRALQDLLSPGPRITSDR